MGLGSLRRHRWCWWFLPVVLMAGVAVWLYSPWWVKSQWEHPYGRIGDIPVPEGYVRIPDSGSGFSDFLRDLPLHKEGSKVREYIGNGVNDTIQPYNYRVVRLPLLSQNEQCADVCMRLRAEYLFRERKFFQIHFDDTQGQTHRYWWGGWRREFIKYMRKVYRVSNTESMKNEMGTRALADMQVGDVLVYDWKSRENEKYGHAVMVADMAVNPATGEKVFMLVQGSTPACLIHVMKNVKDPMGSPWFRLDPDAQELDFGYVKYFPNELRHF